MKRSDNRAALTDEVARFQAEVRRLALAAVRAIVTQELERRAAKLRPTRPRVAKPVRSEIAAAPVVAPAPPPVTAPAAAVAAPAPAGDRTHVQPPATPAGGRKRVPWTRESITNELASWMLSGTAIDATFVKRHGPPGLVAATRRVFGRFEAALNVAALHVSKLYPDGPPKREAAEMFDGPK